MRRLLRAAGLATGATLLPRHANAFVAAHNWDRYDWGTAPGVTDRLYQGPFPDDLVPRWDVVMAPTPSAEVAPNFGMGLVTYVWDEAGQKKTAKSLEQSIEELVAFPLGSLVYIRADGRVDVGGSLDPGYPLPGRIRQARFILPHGVDWKGLGLSAELEVKGVRRPVRWACRQRLEDGGALTLRPTVGLGDIP